jgi:putative endonuclease
VPQHDYNSLFWALKMGNYFCYIITNYSRTVLYTGVTNDLEIRLIEHFSYKGNPKNFTGKYNCHYLLWYQRFDSPNDAIEREKEIKGWKREKKIALIKDFNPDFKFLNSAIMEWPPREIVNRKDD